MRYLLIIGLFSFGIIGCNANKKEESKQEQLIQEIKETKHVYDFSFIIIELKSWITCSCPQICTCNCYSEFHAPSEAIIR